jgi:CheY-like chemotaxis protein
LPVPAPQPLRVEPGAVQAALKRLEREARPAVIDDRRADPRFDYRLERVTVETLRDGEIVGVHEVVPRNLSRSGIGFIGGQFVYPGTSCRVILHSPYGRDQHIAGKLARCRYLVGSGTLYELGARFEQRIDPSLYIPGARLVRILVVDVPATRRLVERVLEARYVHVSCVVNPRDAINTALTLDTDLLMIDLESDAFDGFRLSRRLRRRGFLQPIIGMAVSATPELRSRCEAAGCTGYLVKPLTREALEQLLDALHGAPLFSALADDPTMTPLINEFVRGLKDLAREMSAALERGDLDTVHEIARQLRADAGSYGFEPITREAEHVQSLAAIEAPAAHLRRALNDLIDLCLTAQPATVDDDLPPAGEGA